MKEMTLREIQLFSLEILKEFHDFCESRGLRYSVAYGTLIGAVRHKGFIPWDDDIDVVMPRPDFERFIREFASDRFKVCVPGEDSYQPIARVYDTRDTIAYNTYPYKTTGRDGQWIDLYALDNVSDDPDEFMAQAEESRAIYNRSVKARKMLAAPADLRRVPPAGHFARRLIRLAIKRMTRGRGSVMRLTREQLSVIKRYPWGSTGHVSQLGVRGWVYSDHLPADLLDHTELVPFEDMMVRVPRDYDRFLSPQYPDYMTIPPEEKRVCHTSAKFYWKNR